MGTYTSVATIHSTSTNAGFIDSNPPHQIFTSSGSQRTYRLLGSGGAVPRIAYFRSEVEISSPWIFVQWRLAISHWSGFGLDSLSLGCEVAVVGRIEGGGG